MGKGRAGRSRKKSIYVDRPVQYEGAEEAI